MLYLHCIPRTLTYPGNSPQHDTETEADTMEIVEDGEGARGLLADRGLRIVHYLRRDQLPSDLLAVLRVCVANELELYCIDERQAEKDR